MNIARIAVRAMALIPAAGLLALNFAPVACAAPPKVTERDYPVEPVSISAPAPERAVQTVIGKSYIYSDEIPMSYGQQLAMQMACEDYGVPYALALGIAETESGFDFDAWSGWAYGLMQISPVNYGWLRAEGIEPEDRIGNIKAGCRIIGELLERYDAHKALMAYNMGEYGAAELWAQGVTESEYSRKVVEAMAKWEEVLNRPAGSPGKTERLTWCART